MIYVSVINVATISTHRVTKNLSLINGTINITCGFERTSDFDTPPDIIRVVARSNIFSFYVIYITGKEYEKFCTSSSYIGMFKNRYTNQTQNNVQYEQLMLQYLNNETSRRCIYERQTTGQREVELLIHHPNLLLMNIRYTCTGIWRPNYFNNSLPVFKSSSKMFSGLLWPKYGNQYDLGPPTLASDVNTSLILQCPIPFAHTNIIQWGESNLPHTPIIPTRLIQMSNKNSDETYLPSLKNLNSPNSPNIKVQEGEFFKRLQTEDNTDLFSETRSMCYVSTKYAKSLYPIQGKENCFNFLSFAYSHPNRSNVKQHTFYNLTYLLHNKVLDFDGKAIDDEEFHIFLNRSKIRFFLFQLPSLFYMRSIQLNSYVVTRPNITVGEERLLLRNNTPPLYIRPTIDIYKDFMTYLITWVRLSQILKIKRAQTTFVETPHGVMASFVSYKCQGKMILIISNNNSRCTYSKNINKPNVLFKLPPLFQTDSNPEYSVVGLIPYPLNASQEFNIVFKVPYDDDDNVPFSCSWQKYLCFEGIVDGVYDTTIQLIEPNPWEMDITFYSNIYRGFENENEWTVIKDVREITAVRSNEVDNFYNNIFLMHEYLRKTIRFDGLIIKIKNYLDKNNICPCRPILTDLKIHNNNPKLLLSPNKYDPTDKFYCNIFYDTNSIKPLYLWEALEQFMCIQSKSIDFTTIRTRIFKYQPQLYIEMFSTNLTHVSYVCRNIFSHCFELYEDVIDHYVYFNFDNNTMQIKITEDLNTTIVGLNQTFNFTFTALPLPLNYTIEPYEFNHMLVVPKSFAEGYREINCQHMMQTSKNKETIPTDSTKKNLVSLKSCTSYNIKANIYDRCIICSVNGSSDCYDKPRPKYSLVSDEYTLKLTCSKDPNNYFVNNILVDKTRTDFMPNMWPSREILHFYCHKDSQNNINSAVLCVEKDIINKTDNIIDSLPDNSICGSQYSNGQHINISNNELQPYSPQCLPLPSYIRPVISIHQSKTHLCIQCKLPKWIALPVCTKNLISLRLYFQSTKISYPNEQLFAKKMGNLCITYPYSGISCIINNNLHHRTLLTLHISVKSRHWYRIFGTNLNKIRIQSKTHKNQLSRWRTIHLYSNKSFNNNSFDDDITSTTITKASTGFTTIKGKTIFHHLENNKYIYLVFISMYIIIICIPVIIVMYIIKSQQNIKIKNAFQ